MQSKAYWKHVATIRKSNQIKIKEKIKNNKGKWLNKNESLHCQFICKIQCQYGHKFQLHKTRLLNDSWCPFCQDTLYRGEEITRIALEMLLNEEFPKTRRLPGLVNKQGAALEIDGYSEKLGIGFEYQGAQHYRLTNIHNYNDAKFKKMQQHDKIKKSYFKKQNLVLLIIPEFHSFNSTKVVTRIQKILAAKKLNFKSISIEEFKQKVYHIFINVPVKPKEILENKPKKRRKSKKKSYIRIKRHLTLKTAIKISNRYTHLSRFKAEQRKVYRWSFHHGFYHQLTKHMIKRDTSKRIFNIQELKKIAKQFNSRVEFQRKSRTAYEFARKNKLLSKICTHMKYEVENLKRNLL